MIDLQNYKDAIQWLERQFTACKEELNDKNLQLALVQSFEVTFNLSESLLREAFSAMQQDAESTFISRRELLWRASDEGLHLSSREQWAVYETVLDSLRSEAMTSIDFRIDDLLDVLDGFRQDLTSFADRVEERLAAHA